LKNIKPNSTSDYISSIAKAESKIVKHLESSTPDEATTLELLRDIMLEELAGSLLTIDLGLKGSQVAKAKIDMKPLADGIANGFITMFPYLKEMSADTGSTSNDV
jgi:hypothetical protein